MAVVVDDQLALAASLGLLDLSATIHDGPVSTTYGFHIRLLSAASSQRPGRPTRSPLKRLLVLADELGEASRIDRLSYPDPDTLRLINPLESAARTAMIRERFAVSLLIAEALAAATLLPAPLLFTKSNASDRLIDACGALRVTADFVTLMVSDTGLVTVEPAGDVDLR